MAIGAFILAVAPALKVAVLDLEATGVEREVARNISEVLATEISRRGCCTVISAAEIAAVLGFERQKQLLNCSEDASCIAEVGGALGVDKLCAGNVGKLGKTYLLTLKLIDIRSARVEGRFTDRVTGEVDALLESVERGVGEIFQPARAPAPPPPIVAAAAPPAPTPAAPPPAPAAPARPPDPAPAPAVAPAATAPAPLAPTAPEAPFPWGWVLVGAAGAAAGGAAGTAFAGNASYAEYERLLRDRGADERALVERANLFAGAAIALAVAAVASAAGGVFFLTR